MKNHLVCVIYSLSCGTMYGQFGPSSSAAQQTPEAQQLPLSGREQNGTVTPNETPAASGGANSVNTLNPSLQIEGVFQGSVRPGAATTQSLPRTLQDAIKRGIQYNLGTISAGEAARMARAERLAAIAQMLPDIAGSVGETVQQINLAAEGLRIRVPLPGFNFPTVVGPFNYFDARANLTESLSLTALQNWRSSQQNARAAELSIKDSRDLVTLAISGSYLQLLASLARIQTANAQIETAQAVYQQALDRNRSGLNARIDVTRSLVELQTQQQRLTTLTNDLEKQKIRLARLIGLPLAQVFTLSDAIPYREFTMPQLDEMIQRAFSERPDVRAAAAQVKAAELARKAAEAEYYPSIGVSADYGAIGVNPSRDAHGTFLVNGAVVFPIFQSGRVRADIDQAEAALAQRKSEYEDTKGRAEEDVRTAFLDLTAGSQQVRVAESNRALAGDTLQQARDRFRAGVADTVELVQAQESVATAEQDYISALFAFNLAQVSLARAVGQTEQGVVRLLQRK
jgi:outer membrane protein TolC